MEWVVVGLFGLACVAFVGQRLHKQWLRRKYKGDPYQADVLAGTIRVGMTAEQLVDAWGPPVAIDERVFKTKVVHTYKYAQTGARSFRQRVKVENGIIVGWTQT